MPTKLRLIVAAVLAGILSSAVAAETFSALRGSTPLNQEAAPPALVPQINTSVREPRSYPEQPPVIPHSIEGYEISTNANKCLSCHARTRVHESQAPMVSITHFFDRDGQVLASISPRRYFCTECHVPQHNVHPPVDNDFVDIDSLLKAKGPNPGARR
ncbi:MAG TPA: nitrate reductase cytochrome c-type subunit [Pseudolabrys sp.]|nr:nitrate reductase cytochrome c-type subunit [Pseudolabrys sp.]